MLSKFDDMCVDVFDFVDAIEQGQDNPTPYNTFIHNMFHPLMDLHIKQK